jgi:N-methylhydantoinase B
MSELLDYTERLTLARLRTMPAGDYEFRDFMDNDGNTDEPVPIQVRLSISVDGLIADFEGSAPERPGSVNAVAAVTHSAVYYAIFCLLGEGTPLNGGCFRPVTVRLPAKSIVSPTVGRAVSAGNVETSQRIVDVVLGALAKALPEVIPAASSGTMNNVVAGGFDPVKQRPFTYYETLAGGAGAGPQHAGLDAVHTHMTNTLNTPVETIEAAFPMRIAEYSVIEGSGGTGTHPGGNGLRRTYEFLTDASLTLVSERRTLQPWGANNGKPGRSGRNRLVRSDGTEVPLASKETLAVHPGDRLIVETPGGGGWGAARSSIS